MQKTKRLRVFAGPNGSGKSTLFEVIKEKFNTGYFINADTLADQLVRKGFIDLSYVGIKATANDLGQFKKTNAALTLLNKAKNDGKSIDFELTDNFIVDKSKNTDGYEASFVAAFIRYLLYKKNKSFSFETVMSHPSKIEEIREAKAKGYKTYLYFVCTDDAEINVSRVANRVKKGGHDVDEGKIRSRYTDTLKNLYPVIMGSYRAYLFDNSGKELKLIAEIYDGVLKLSMDNPPNWFIDYVLPNFKLSNLINS